MLKPQLLPAVPVPCTDGWPHLRRMGQRAGAVGHHAASGCGGGAAGAVVDTAVFSALAFWLLAPNPKRLEVVAQIAGLQLLAKVAGGSLWAWALARTVQRVAA
jgi:hypothetical protein